MIKDSLELGNIQYVNVIVMLDVLQREIICSTDDGVHKGLP